MIVSSFFGRLGINIVQVFMTFNYGNSVEAHHWIMTSAIFQDIQNKERLINDYGSKRSLLEAKVKNLEDIKDTLPNW